VSGGGDSIALMHLAADWLRATAVPLERGSVLTVDHGLRDGSAREAAATAAWARSVGFPAHILRAFSAEVAAGSAQENASNRESGAAIRFEEIGSRSNWRGTRPRSNVEDSARNARYRLIGDWCRANKVATVLLAHTRDDQAETFLLRLGRGSGVDGLSAMRGRAPFPLPGYHGLELVRPLLDMGRDELRSDLIARGAAWLEDPMNEDPRFARVRIRQALPALEAAGVSTVRIAQAAQHLGRAREALEADTERFLERHARFEPDGVAVFDGAALRAEPREIGLRALSAILMRVSGATYRPRLERLERAYDALRGSMRGLTLSGCRIGPSPRELRRFGAATLEVRRERPRKHRSPREDAAQEKHPAGTMVEDGAAKLPKKRRIIPRLSGS
jgi:tRNA(Ile)-lysidine synthase